MIFRKLSQDSTGPGRDPRGPGVPEPRTRFAGGDRGASAVVAFVLLIGLVAVGSVSILALGGAVVEETAGDAEEERAEVAFRQFGSELDAVAASEDGTRTVDLDVRSGGDGVVRDRESGRFVVTRYDGTTETVVDRSIGSVVYHQGGTSYTYEAGAIWRGSGRTTRMVSAPAVTYHGATLTLPLTDIDGDGRIHSDRITATKTRTVAPLNDVSMVRGELISIEITSDYYLGWARFFRENVDGVSVEVDHELRRTTIHLAEPVIDGSLDTGIVASGDIYASNPSTTPRTSVRTTGDIHGDIDCGGSCETNVADLGVESIDAAVEVRAMTAKKEVNGSHTTITGGETLEAGVYYLPDDTYLDGVDDVTVDLADGDVTLVMDGNLGLKNTRLNVVNGSESGGVLRVFANHTDVAIGNGAGVAVENDTASRLQIYGTSDSQFAMGQANDEGFTGVFYAPRSAPAGGVNDAVEDMDLSNARCDTDICIGKGSGEVKGAIVGGDVTIEQNSNFTYAPSLAGVEPSVDESGMYPPPITYLHVMVNEVEVEPVR